MIRKYFTQLYEGSHDFNIYLDSLRTVQDTGPAGQSPGWLLNNQRIIRCGISSIESQAISLIESHLISLDDSSLKN